MSDLPEAPIVSLTLRGGDVYIVATQCPTCARPHYDTVATHALVQGMERHTCRRCANGYTIEPRNPPEKS